MSGPTATGFGYVRGNAKLTARRRMGCVNVSVRLSRMGEGPRRQGAVPQSDAQPVTMLACLWHAKQHRMSVGGSQIKSSCAAGSNAKFCPAPALRDVFQYERPTSPPPAEPRPKMRCQCHTHTPPFKRSPDPLCRITDVRSRELVPGAPAPQTMGRHPSVPLAPPLYIPLAIPNHYAFEQRVGAKISGHVATSARRVFPT